MKTFTHILTVLAALLVAFAALAAADDSMACTRKSHGAAIANAIGKFCQRGRYAGTAEAYQGMFSNDNFGAHYQVKIAGNCKSPQFVPRDVCFAQFWNLCATGKADGSNSRWYGWKGNNCQQWIIRQNY